MNRFRGFALLEVIIAVAIVAGASLVVMRGLSSSTSSAAANTSRHDLTSGLERALESIRHDFEYGGLSTLATEQDDVVVPMLDGIRYDNSRCRAVINVTAAGVEYGPDVSYQFEMERTELPDGKDNDKDGIVDEGMLVRVDAGGARQILRVAVTKLEFLKLGDELSCTMTFAKGKPANTVTTQTQRIVFTIVNN